MYKEKLEHRTQYVLEKCPRDISLSPYEKFREKIKTCCHTCMPNYINIHSFFFFLFSNKIYSTPTGALENSADYKTNVMILLSREINNYLMGKRVNTDSYHPIRPEEFLMILLK